MYTIDFLKEKNIDCVFGEGQYTKTEERTKEYDSNKHTVRSVSPNEIMIEIDLEEDTPENRQLAYKIQDSNYDYLIKNGFEVYYFDHKGKSPYLRLYNILKLNKDNQKGFFEAFVEKYCIKLKKGFSYDSSFYGAFHWCPIEFGTHTKYRTKVELIKNNIGSNIAEKELLEKVPITKNRQIELNYLNILQKNNANEKERVSCIMQIFNKMKLNKDETMAFVIKHNKWDNFDPIITANKIEGLWKYTEKPNPIKHDIEITKKKKIVVPGYDRLISEWAKDISKEIKDKYELFYRVDAKEIVQIGKIKILDDEEETYTGFIQIKPSQFITALEKYIIPGIIVKDRKTDEYIFKGKSISKELATTTLESEVLKHELPQLQRIFTIPIPILYKGEITFPKQGYDKRFGSWLPYDAPTITNPDMSLEEAKEIIKNIFKEFCFETKRDAHNAIAGLLTPFLRGLFPKFSTRTPVFFYLANRERAGKDYCAGVTGIVYEGFNLEESPISNSDKHNNNSEELRKKLLSSMIGGRKRMHFSNNKGYIDNAVFEAITTTEKYTDRMLGKNQNLTFDNELDFSLSGNVGVGFTPDFSNRCRFVRLFLEIENANERQFENSDLHGWVLENRSKIISALYSLVRNWEDKGMPEGSVNFASFPSWAKICGGIMECAGYENPCITEKDIVTVAGDAETNDMKILFEKAHEKHKEMKITKQAILSIVDEEELFSDWDLYNNRGDQTKFGNLLTKYVGRVLSDIRLIETIPGARPSRQQYIFTKKKHESKIIEF